MFAVKSLIKENLDRYPDFEYLYINIDKSINNLGVYNDVAIDCSKSLIEATCKNILINLSPSEDHTSAEKYKLKKVFEKAISEISKFHEPFDSDVIAEMVLVVNKIGEIRNKRGDVSHGRVSPKLEESNLAFAKFIMQTSARICEYLLSMFFEIDIYLKTVVEYEENPEFNDFLDSTFEETLEEKADYVDVIYSKALYEQDYDDYDERLQEYLAQQEEQEEPNE